ncbi:MAG: thioredoxin family protein [Actinomycetota bacterium]|nr:thioredoxin family protein [Actinomycetota bacterium]
MRVTLQYFDDCPNWTETDRHLRILGLEYPELEVMYRKVDTPELAETIGFRGSPSIIIDGVDPFAAVSAPVGLSCRVYPTPDGLVGSPTLEQLREVIERSE